MIPLVIGAFGTGGIVLSGTTIGALAGTTIGLALGWGVYEACKWVDSTYNQVDTTEKEQIEEKQKSPQIDGKKKPSLLWKRVGKYSTKCPGEGFKWRGRGAPETGKGSWVKDYRLPTEEKLHPDIQHPPPKAPHWDYEGPDYPQGVELYLDGSWKLKQ